MRHEREPFRGDNVKQMVYYRANAREKETKTGKVSQRRFGKFNFFHTKTGVEVVQIVEITGVNKLIIEKNREI